MALTGTPLINDIEDFRAIWQFLGWIDDKKPLAELMDALEETVLTPADRGFYPAARKCVVDLGIVRRRRSTWPPTSPPHRRPARRARRQGQPFDPRRRARPGSSHGSRVRALARRKSGSVVEASTATSCASRHVGAEDHTKTDENVFSMVRRIGQAKPARRRLPGWLARPGKVVFAKHRRHGRCRGDHQTPDRFSSIRGARRRRGSRSMPS
jgi:hypothetical protein